MKSSVIALVACTATAKNNFWIGDQSDDYWQSAHANDYNQRGMSTRLCNSFNGSFIQCLRTYCLSDLSEYYYSTMETVFNNAPHMTI